MSARWTFAVGVALALGATSARAQQTDTTARSLACAPSGATLRAWAGAPDTTPRLAPRADRARAVRDTVITLDITDRTWTRDSTTAGVAIGAAGVAGSRRAPWQACVGASVLLSRVTATLHNVHGQFRFRADPGALRSIGAASDSTPPLGPPRR